MTDNNDNLPRDITPAIAERVEIAHQTAQSVIDIVVDSDDGMASASDDLIHIKAYQKQVKDMKTECSRPLHQRKQAVLDWFRPAEAFLSDAEAALKQAIGGYQEQVARAAAAAAQAEAKRLEKLAEQRAQRAEKNGDIETATDIRVEAMQSSALTLAAAQSTVPTVKGIGSRTLYEAVVINKLVFLQAVIAGTVPERFIEINMTELNKVANALKDDLNYPGVAVQTRHVVTARSA